MDKMLNKIKKFRDERDWMKFHNPKDMAVSIIIEAGELLEHFQWKTNEEAGSYVKKHKSEIADEIADVGLYLFELADNLNIDLLKAMSRKLEKNKKKYPVRKSRGTARKYNRL